MGKNVEKDKALPEELKNSVRGFGTTCAGRIDNFGKDEAPIITRLSQTATRQKRRPFFHNSVHRDDFVSGNHMILGNTQSYRKTWILRGV